MEFTARAIAELVGGKVEGNADVAVHTFAKIEEGRPGALTFLANPKYAHYIYDTEASIVLVSNDFEAERPIAATLIRVADPYVTLALLMETVSNTVNPQPTGIEQPNYVAEGVDIPDKAYIGAFAYIGAGACLGRGVKIYPQAYIGPGVELGEDTIVYAGAKIYPGVKVGRRCIIHSGAVLGADGFGFAPRPDGTYDKIPQMGNVVIGNDVEIGANTTIDRATMGSTRIGDGTKLDNLIQIAHNVTVGRNTVMAAQGGVAGSAHIGDNCVFAGQVGIAGHIKVGDRTVIGAQSGIPNNVAPDSRVMGYPAVPAGTFARQTAMMRRLAELFDRVDALEKNKKE